MIDLKTIRSENRTDLIKEIFSLINKGFELLGKEQEEFDDEFSDFPKFKCYKQSLILFKGDEMIKHDDGTIEIHDFSKDNEPIKELHHIKQSGDVMDKSLIFKIENGTDNLFKIIDYSNNRIGKIWEGSFELENYDSKFYSQKREYIIDGKVSSFWDNGDLDYTYMYKDGLRNGKSISYEYSTNKISSESYYINDVLHGKQTHYNHGNVSIIENYIHGKKDGEYIIYDDDGKIKRVTIYMNNIEQKEIFYTPSGRELVGYYKGMNKNTGMGIRYKGSFVHFDVNQPGFKFGIFDVTDPHYEHIYENGKVVSVNKDEEYFY